MDENEIEIENENALKKELREPKPASFETIEGEEEIANIVNRENEKSHENSETIELLMDVELELTAQLGEAELPIKKVLDFTKGSIIELDTYTANPIDLLANGKVIARGEVVIIQDNFGLRITEVGVQNKVVQ